MKLNKVLLAAVFAAVGNVQAGAPVRDAPVVQAGPSSAQEAFPDLPDVRITAVTEAAVPVPHCKVAGLIGTETNLEVLLPDDWNGKFLMGDGGRFAGIVINSAMFSGPLQSGYATVGTDNSWGDMAFSPYGTIAYCKSVLERYPGAADDVRLMIFPGVKHCHGGIARWWVNYRDVIDNWVETGEAPDQHTASWLDEQNQPDGSRPVCAYPKYLVYNG